MHTRPPLLNRTIMSAIALGAISTVFAMLLAFYGTSFGRMVMILLPLGGISGALYTLLVGIRHVFTRGTA